MMLRNLMIGLLFLVSSMVQAQYFEGKVVYRIDFELSEALQKMGATKDAVQEAVKGKGIDLGKHTYWYSADGFYKEITKEVDGMVYIIYRPDSNALYHINEDEPLVKIRDVSVSSAVLNGTASPNWSMEDTTVTMLGKTCKVMKRTVGREVVTYYYSEGFLPVDPSPYQGFKYNYWNEYTDFVGYLPIYIEMDVSGIMLIKLTMISYSEEPVDRSMFQLPELEMTKDAKRKNRENVEQALKYLEKHLDKKGKKKGK